MPNDTSHIKRTIDLTFYARILIAVAIALLAFGFVLDVNGSTKLIDPVKGVNNTSKKGETITTIDIFHWNDDIEEIGIEPIDNISINTGGGNNPSTGGTGSESGDTGNTGSTPTGGKTGGTGNHGGWTPGTNPGGNPGGGNTGGNPGGGTSPSPSPSPSSSPSPSPSPSPTTPPTPTLDEVNNNLRNSIQNTYGITVKYGSETNGYYVGGLSTNSISNASVVNASLNQLNTAMSLYPNGFWREIKNGGIPLTVYLIDSYSAYGVTGVTDSNYSFANISIAVSYPFEDTFFHESYHYIERYIFKKGIYYTSWEGYNPGGFTYGSLWRDQSFARTGAAGAYFVNDYAQTSAEEDRASTFEYMMRASYSSCFSPNQPIWRKAKTMSDSIDAAFNTVSPGTTEYWERHL